MNNYTTKPKRRRIWKTIFYAIAIILALGIIAGGFYAATVDLKEDTDSTERAYLNPKSEVVSSSNNPNVLGSGTTNTETPVTPTEPQTKTFTSDIQRFTAQIPSDWTASNVNGQVVISSAKGEKFNIQMYNSPRKDLSALKTFLEGQSNISNVTTSKISEYDALRFNISGDQKYGYAVLSNGRLYYLLGNGIENSPIGSTFKTY